jgi:hypothetical protein
VADNIEHVISYWVLFQTFHSPALAGFRGHQPLGTFLLFSLVHRGARGPERLQAADIRFRRCSVHAGVRIMGNALSHRDAADGARRS